MGCRNSKNAEPAAAQPAAALVPARVSMNQVATPVAAPVAAPVASVSPTAVSCFPLYLLKQFSLFRALHTPIEETPAVIHGPDFASRSGVVVMRARGEGRCVTAVAACAVVWVGEVRGIHECKLKPVSGVADTVLRLTTNRRD